MPGSAKEWKISCVAGSISFVRATEKKEHITCLMKIKGPEIRNLLPGPLAFAGLMTRSSQRTCKKKVLFEFLVSFTGAACNRALFSRLSGERFQRTHR